MAGEDGHDHVNDPALVAKISHVLLSHACQRINFSLGKAERHRQGLSRCGSRADRTRESTSSRPTESATRSIPAREASYIGNPESIIIRPHIERPHSLQSTGHRARGDPRHSGQPIERQEGVEP